MIHFLGNAWMQLILWTFATGMAFFALCLENSWHDAKSVYG